MYNELHELSMQRNLFQISFWVLFARERKSLVGVTTLQEEEGNKTPKEANKLLTRQIEALTETLSKLPQQLQAVEGCPTCGGTHEPGQCVSQQDTSREGNSSGFHQGGAGFNHGPPGFNQGRNFMQGSGWRNQGNQYKEQRNQQPYQPPYQHPSQGPNQQDKPTNIEELLLQFIQETRSHQKSTDAAIRNLEVQMGQLAQDKAERPTRTFGANTEKNPKEECKVVLTRGQRKAQEEETKSKRGVKRKVLRGNRRVKKKASEVVSKLQTLNHTLVSRGKYHPCEESKASQIRKIRLHLAKVAQKGRKKRRNSEAQSNRGVKRASGAKRATNCRR
ncbi:hypothetical protein GmHk_12G034553 [Glycine max]|nr:hypothetical protein GmHk_12G034553 [Glycine max]